MIDIESRLAELALQLSTLQGHWDNGIGLIQNLLRDFPKIQREMERQKQDVSSHQEIVKGTKEDFFHLQEHVKTIRDEFARQLYIEVANLKTLVADRHKGVLKEIDHIHSVMAEKHDSIDALSDNHTMKIETLEQRIKEIMSEANKPGAP